MSCAFGLSDPGRVRKINEDAFVCVDDLQLYIVADGMGGHMAGEVASRLAIEAIVGFMKRSVDVGELSWPYGIDPELSLDGNRLCTAIKLANRRVFRAAEEHDSYTGMGTTVVALLVTPDRLVFGHVGDSRLYRRSGDSLQQMTKDDSWAATILVHEIGHDKAALAKHPMRNVLTNVLGVREQVDIHLSDIPRQDRDLLLLCTDGLHGSIEDEAIDEIMTSDSDLAVVARRLVDAALDSGGRDNVTALVVACNGAPA